jgi:hypothetical protein
MLLDCNNNGLLNGLEMLLRNVFIPSLQAQKVRSSPLVHGRYRAF